MNTIKIGVSGHRQIDVVKVPYILTELDHYFTTLQQTYPDVQFVALSPLAIGADQLFAQWALDNGWLLHVLLPFPLEEYTRDFTKTEELNQLHNLLSQAAAVTVMPAAPTRKEAYLRVGKEVVDQSKEWVAIWDFNKAAEKIGGTANIVRYHFEKYGDKKCPFTIHYPRNGEEPLIANGYLTRRRYEGILIKEE